MHFAGEVDKKDLFFKYWPSSYIEYYKETQSDIFCLAEAPLDDEKGNSTFLEAFSKALNLQYYKVYVNDKSWIVEGKWYGTVIFSKFPFISYESFNLPNPKLEVDHADGTHWIMHDKGAQKAQVEIGNTKINIFNLHYFPVHHFGKRIDDPELQPMRKSLAEILKPQKNEVSIITGDFNNKKVEIEQAFPEIFEGEQIKRAISFNPNDYFEKKGDPTQIDHILYSTTRLKLLDSKVEKSYSDHVGLTASFEID